MIGVKVLWNLVFDWCYKSMESFKVIIKEPSNEDDVMIQAEEDHKLYSEEVLRRNNKKVQETPVGIY